MLSPKKWIPKLAVAALPLTGVACSGDSNGGGGVNPAEGLGEALRGFCMKLAECYPDSSVDIEECYGTFSYYLAAAETAPAGCVNAVAGLFNCYNSLTCEEFMNDEDYYACGEEFDPIIMQACGE